MMPSGFSLACNVCQESRNPDQIAVVSGTVSVDHPCGANRSVEYWMLEVPKQNPTGPGVFFEKSVGIQDFSGPISTRQA
jgi:hypothetical protein